jgi:hypothetical protein
VIVGGAPPLSEILIPDICLRSDANDRLLLCCGSYTLEVRGVETRWRRWVHTVQESASGLDIRL